LGSCCFSVLSAFSWRSGWSCGERECVMMWIAGERA
jgi:hypothetical protein